MKRRGQALIETSLILAAFMGLLLGIVGIGQSLCPTDFLRARPSSRALGRSERLPTRSDSQPGSIRDHGPRCRRFAFHGTRGFRRFSRSARLPGNKVPHHRRNSAARNSEHGARRVWRGRYGWRSFEALTNGAAFEFFSFQRTGSSELVTITSATAIMRSTFAMLS